MYHSSRVEIISMGAVNNVIYKNMQFVIKAPRLTFKSFRLQIQNLIVFRNSGQKFIAHPVILWKRERFAASKVISKLNAIRPLNRLGCLINIVFARIAKIQIVQNIVEFLRVFPASSTSVFTSFGRMASDIILRTRTVLRQCSKHHPSEFSCRPAW